MNLRCRSFLLGLAVAALAMRCSLHPSSDRVPAPPELVVGHSPDSGRTGIDGSAESPPPSVVVDASSPGPASGCTIVATGGQLPPLIGCRVEQEADRHPFDAGTPFFSIREWPEPSVVSDPRVRIAVLRYLPPTIGVQSSSSYVGTIFITIGTASWIANSPQSGALGRFSMTLDSVSATSERGRLLYEIHGWIDAQLVPEVQGTAVGVIDVRVTF
jgi:hypothetical protein